MSQPSPPAFGTAFTTHMVTARYRDGVWSEPRLQPTAPLELHPGTHALHYGSTCFEGMKAFASPSGEVRIFRLQDHVARMRRSAEIVCLPDPGSDLLEGMITTLVAASHEQVPQSPGALYLRPVMLGADPEIGGATAASKSALLFVVACPVGDYFRGGQRPLRVLLGEGLERSTRGFGSAKSGGNYASALRLQVAAKEKYAADQVLFCPDGIVQEAGAANFIAIRGDEIVTRGLDSSFLDGMTRRSVLELAPSLGFRVTERDLTVDELVSWLPDCEAALTGTAATIAAIGSFVYRERELQVGDGRMGPHTARLRSALTDIQYGRKPDTLGWLTGVESAVGTVG